MKRFIKVPKDIHITDLRTGEQLFLGQAGSSVPWISTFKDFICGTLLQDARFGRTAANVLSGAEIRAALIGEVVQLDEDDYELLKSVLQTPEVGYRPEVAIQLVPFFRAILDATTADPTAQPNAG